MDKFDKSIKRGFSKINELKRSIVLAKVSEEALKTMEKSSTSYQETAKMLELNLLQASSQILAIELEFRNLQRNFAKGGDGDA